VLLREAAERKLKALAGLDAAVQRRRLRAYLLRRGFAVGEMIPVIDALVGRAAVRRRTSGIKGSRRFPDS
jgi:hypothetical protein